VGRRDEIEQPLVVGGTLTQVSVEIDHGHPRSMRAARCPRQRALQPQPASASTTRPSR
jgi:hypothetical protein